MTATVKIPLSPVSGCLEEVLEEAGLEEEAGADDVEEETEEVEETD
jgi:hypothetical protein